METFADKQQSPWARLKAIKHYYVYQHTEPSRHMIEVFYY